MEGVWYKRCPICGTYLTKADPLAQIDCRACGWSEEHSLFFCKEICRYCHLPPRALEARGMQTSGQGPSGG